MKTVSIRDLRTRPREVRESLQTESEALLTANGRPVAILLPVDGATLDETLAMLHRARAQQAIRAIRNASREEGLSEMSEEAIEALIQDVRNKRRRNLP